MAAAYAAMAIGGPWGMAAGVALYAGASMMNENGTFSMNSQKAMDIGIGSLGIVGLSTLSSVGNVASAGFKWDENGNQKGGWGFKGGEGEIALAGALISAAMPSGENVKGIAGKTLLSLGNSAVSSSFSNIVQYQKFASGQKNNLQGLLSSGDLSGLGSLIGGLAGQGLLSLKDKPVGKVAAGGKKDNGHFMNLLGNIVGGFVRKLGKEISSIGRGIKDLGESIFNGATGKGFSTDRTIAQEQIEKDIEDFMKSSAGPAKKVKELVRAAAGADGRLGKLSSTSMAEGEKLYKAIAKDVDAIAEKNGEITHADLLELAKKYNINPAALFSEQTQTQAQIFATTNYSSAYQAQVAKEEIQNVMALANAIASKNSSGEFNMSHRVGMSVTMQDNQIVAVEDPQKFELVVNMSKRLGVQLGDISYQKMIGMFGSEDKMHRFMELQDELRSKPPLKTLTVAYGSVDPTGQSFMMSYPDQQMLSFHAGLSTADGLSFNNGRLASTDGIETGFMKGLWSTLDFLGFDIGRQKLIQGQQLQTEKMINSISGTQDPFFAVGYASQVPWDQARGEAAYWVVEGEAIGLGLRGVGAGLKSVSPYLKDPLGFEKIFAQGLDDGFALSAADISKGTFIESEAIVDKMARLGGIGGATKSTANFSEISTVINPYKQSRHIFESPGYTGKGYLGSFEDAQKVLDAVHSGEAEFLGLMRQGYPAVRYKGVTGINVNKGAGFPEQPTNVFMIKGTKKVSVVPISPDWRPR